MSPTQLAFAYFLRRAIADFYKDPENERRYQEWKRERDAAAAKQVRVPCPAGQAKA